MTRLGWTILSLIVLAAIGFGSMLSFGPAVPDRRAPAPEAPARHGGDGGDLVIPVAGADRSALHDGWGEARGGGTRYHEGIDIPAPRGTPVVAAAAGRVEKLFESSAGGTTLYIRSRDGVWVFYYAHLAGYAPGMREGLAVRAGDTIGYVGDSGNAGTGDTHLHFAVARMRPGDRWWQGAPVNPYPMLAGKSQVR